MQLQTLLFVVRVQLYKHNNPSLVGEHVFPLTTFGFRIGSLYK